jgi:hypothetical protein
MSDSSSLSSYSSVALTIGLTELRADYPTLTGAGVVVAQIEANLDSSGTGAPEFEPNPDINSNASFTFFNGSASSTIYNEMTIGAASPHADTVGDYFYGAAPDDAGAPEGVAPGVTTIDVYFADSFDVSGNLTSFPAKVVNMSFGYDTPAGGNDLFDQIANQFNVVLVGAAGNGGPVISPASAYNVIAVASSTALLSTGPAGDGTEKPDISAPGPATSYAAPIVAGAATLLVEAGTNGLPGWSDAEKSDAVDFRMVKAILLNTATKPADYFTNAYAPTAAQPLSAEYGSGVVNIDAAVTELYAGEAASEYDAQVTLGGTLFTSLAGDPALAENGWALGTLSNGLTAPGGLPGGFMPDGGPGPLADVQGYAVTVTAGSDFVATLTWAAADNDTIDNLELYAFDQATGTLLGSSTATLSNVEQIEFTPTASGIIDLFAVLAEAGPSGNSDIYALAYGDPDAEPVCYCAGTHIRTASGPVAIEALRQGDLVITRDGAWPVRWIGENHVSTRFADPLRVLPIRIAAGALAAGLPARDLLVSPDHAMYLGGVLIQASALINGTTITRATNVPERFVYYHVELPVHALIYAEDALSESFVDNVSRAHFQNWETRSAPEIPIIEMDLPRAKSVRQLPRGLRDQLAARAGVGGFRKLPQYL